MNWPLLLYYIPHTVRGVAGLLTCMASGHFIEYSEQVRLVDMTPAWAHSTVVSSLVPRPRPKIGKGAWCHLQKLQYVPSQHIMQLILIITFYVIDLLHSSCGKCFKECYNWQWRTWFLYSKRRLLTQHIQESLQVTSGPFPDFWAGPGDKANATPPVYSLQKCLTA